MAFKFPWQSSPPKSDPQQSTQLESPSQKKRSFVGIPSKSHWLQLQRLGHLGVVLWGVLGTGLMAINSQGVQSWERSTQSFFYRLRGKVTPPQNIVIIAIDDNSFQQAAFYVNNPQELAYLEPLQQFPWKRSVYGEVIDKVLKAGAKSVGIDLIFDRPSVYGSKDDQQLQQVLQQYAGKVTLAGVYEGENDELRAGGIIRLTQPNSALKTTPFSVGSINVLVEPDGRVYRFGSEFPLVWAKNNPQLKDVFLHDIATVPAFANAVLLAGGFKYETPQGQDIFYYGKGQTFEYISFVDVLDPNSWNGYLQAGQFFKDKIVLIGPTAETLQDFHRTPFDNRIPGIEIHANSIATLLEGRSIRTFFPTPLGRGLFTLIIILTGSYFFSQQKRPIPCLIITGGVALFLLSTHYFLFTLGHLILPTFTPIFCLTLCGFSYSGVRLLEDVLNKEQLRDTLKKYVSSPIVQKIITQTEDLQDLIAEKQKETLEKILAGRYQITEELSSGGFGETYIAIDIQLPNTPKCVVKQLNPISDDPKVWKLAKRLFKREAEVMQKLGEHPNIPQLYAYFEEDEQFYLVQELIEGKPLARELPYAIPMSEAKVIRILANVLEILKFVHSQNVIHRDIKPENLIRRNEDNQLVLIDFGAVKELTTQLIEDNIEKKFTIAIGSRGYTPREQLAGTPRFSSDIYALGMIAVQAVTLIQPCDLEEDIETGEIAWQKHAEISEALLNILTKMTRCDYRERYLSASEVLEDLQPLIAGLPPEESPDLSNEQMPLIFSNVEADQTLSWEDSDS